MAIKSYKGFDKNLRCRGFQYKIGGIYEMDGKIKMRNRGFHACESPFDVFDYYTMIDSRFCEVEQDGNISKWDRGTKICSSKIKIKAELKLADMINLGVEWLKEITSPEKIKTSIKDNSSGNYAKIGSSGDEAQIGSSGYGAKIGSSGYVARLVRPETKPRSARLATMPRSVRPATMPRSVRLATMPRLARLATEPRLARLATAPRLVRPATVPRLTALAKTVSSCAQVLTL